MDDFKKTALQMCSKKRMKTFEEFMKDTGKLATKPPTNKDFETMKHIYNATSSLDFDKWLIFVSEMI